MVSARITERSRNTSWPLDTYAETHGSEESDTPNKGVPSKTQVRRSGTGSSEVVVQSSIVVHFLVVGGRIGLDEVDTVVGTGHSVLVGREKVFAAKSAPCNKDHDDNISDCSRRREPREALRLGLEVASPLLRG
jgi:hypothetical protein